MQSIRAATQKHMTYENAYEHKTKAPVCSSDLGSCNIFSTIMSKNTGLFCKSSFF